MRPSPPPMHGAESADQGYSGELSTAGKSTDQSWLVLLGVVSTRRNPHRNLSSRDVSDRQSACLCASSVCCDITTDGPRVVGSARDTASTTAHRGSAETKTPVERYLDSAVQHYQYMYPQTCPSGARFDVTVAGRQVDEGDAGAACEYASDLRRNFQGDP